MEYRKDGTEIAIRLDQGDEIAGSLMSLCLKEGIVSATFSGIGACRKAEIAHYDTSEKRYHNRKLEGMLEIVSLMGNVTVSEGKPLVHAHIALGLEDFSVAGGHLVSAEIRPTCEIRMRICGIGVKRMQDAESGLRLQRF
jgi:predicted DNA-binding protein with PD1-like motif